MIISRLGPPFGDCRNLDKSHALLNVFEEMYPVNYSSNVSIACITRTQLYADRNTCSPQVRSITMHVLCTSSQDAFMFFQACFKTCYQRHMIERCGCGDAYYPMSGTALGNSYIVACRTTNITQGESIG